MEYTSINNIMEYIIYSPSLGWNLTKMLQNPTFSWVYQSPIPPYNWLFQEDRFMSSYDAHHQIRCKALGQSQAPLGSLVLELWSPKKGRKTNENDAHFVSHMTQIWVTWKKIDTISYCCCIDHFPSYFKCLDSCKNWKGLKFTISTSILLGGPKIFVFAGVFFAET